MEAFPWGTMHYVSSPLSISSIIYNVTRTREIKHWLVPGKDDMFYLWVSKHTCSSSHRRKARSATACFHNKLPSSSSWLLDIDYDVRNKVGGRDWRWHRENNCWYTLRHWKGPQQLARPFCNDAHKKTSSWDQCHVHSLVHCSIHEQPSYPSKHISHAIRQHCTLSGSQVSLLSIILNSHLLDTTFSAVKTTW